MCGHMGGPTKPQVSTAGRIRWCTCGQSWIPAAGLYNTTEEQKCPACVLRSKRAENRAEELYAIRVQLVKEDEP
jgi:hypothetical protein